jgi:predicted GIY-YIG superfamily endonuclease
MEKQISAKIRCPAKAGTHTEAASMFFVYLLASKPHGTLYAGSTSDLVRRVWEHKVKAASGFNAKYGVDRLGSVRKLANRLLIEYD